MIRLITGLGVNLITLGLSLALCEASLSGRSKRFNKNTEDTGLKVDINVAILGLLPALYKAGSSLSSGTKVINLKFITENNC